MPHFARSSQLTRSSIRASSTSILALCIATLACAPPLQSSTVPADAVADMPQVFGLDTDTGAVATDVTSADTSVRMPSDVAESDGSVNGADSAALDGDDVAGVLSDGQNNTDGSDSSASNDSGADGLSTHIDGADQDQTNPLNPDATTTDGGQVPQPKPCGQITFTYKAAAGVKQVLLAGSFNGWASTPTTAEVMLDTNGDGVRTTTLSLSPGNWQYKFIVDGKWIVDPANANTVTDGFGGKNSLRTVQPCPQPLKLDSSSLGTDSLTAVFSTPLGKIDPQKVSITLDNQPISAKLYSWVKGKLTLDIQGLAKGIHDVRVLLDTPTGQRMWLLKIYVGISTDWRDSTIYFTMTDRFLNGDTSNDKPFANVDKRTNFAGGDFAGISAKIDSGYFSALGVGALWLSWPTTQPDFAEPGSHPDGTGCGMGTKTKSKPVKYAGYHGYWPVDPDKIEPRFGTLAELKTLVTKAHAKGIRILLDYTANHLHTSSPWFKKYKDKGWFHTPAEVCGDIGWDKKPVSCWFTSYLADFNYSNPAAIDASLTAALGLAKKVGADGFRLDAVKHLEMDFIKALRQRAKAEMELTGIDFYIVGETFTGDAGEIQSFIGNDKIHAQFDFPANMQLLQGFAKTSKGLDAMDKTIRGIRSVYTDSGSLMSTFIGNHDMARFISHASGGVSCGIWDIISNQAAGWVNPPKQPTGQTPYNRLMLAFTYIYTTPGIPLIYYGDEFGLPGAGDPDNRRVMRFDGALSSKETATLSFIQKLGKLRASHPALRHGAWSKPLWTEANFLSWARTATGDQVLVLLNRGGSAKQGQLTVTPAGIADGTQFTEWFTGKKAKIAGGKLVFDVPAGTAQVWTTQ